MSKESSFHGAPAALALYAVLAVALTWPLAFHLTDRVPAGDNDLWQNYWNFWSWRTALVDRHQSPYATDLIYQPGQISLAFHTHSEANVLTTLPISAALGVPAALNTAVLLGFILAAWGGYFLARELVQDRRAAFLGGLVVAFFPHHFEQSLEHVNLASYQAMPFFLLFLVRLARAGGIRNVVLAAVFYAINALYSWHNGLLVLPIGAVLFACEVSRSQRAWALALRDATAAGAIAFVLLLPFAWPMLHEILAGSSGYLKPPVHKAVDPLFLLVPAENHPILGWLVQGLYDRFRGYPSAGFTCYLGLAAVVLWIAGGWMTTRSADRRAALPEDDAPRFAWALWTVLFFLNVVLALGDSLTLAGKDTGIPLPFALLRHVPALKTIRLPNRFVVPAMIALGVLAAHGASLLIRRKGARLGLVLALLVLVDFLWVPYPTRELPHPKWLDAVASAPSGLLLDVPGGHHARGAEDMYFQTIHRRPTVGGYTSSTPEWMEKRVDELPFLKLVFEGRPQIDLDTAGIERELLRVLRALPVKIIVVHLDRTRESLEKMSAANHGTALARLYNPEKGAPARVIDDTRTALRKIWGEPMYKDERAELYVRP